MVRSEYCTGRTTLDLEERDGIVDTFQLRSIAVCSGDSDQQSPDHGKLADFEDEAMSDSDWEAAQHRYEEEFQVTAENEAKLDHATLKIATRKRKLYTGIVIDISDSDLSSDGEENGKLNSPNPRTKN